MRTDTELHDAVLEQFGKLPPEQRDRLLHLVKTLSERKTTGVQGKDLVNISGGFNPSDLEIMAVVIEQSCGGMDLDGQ